MSVGSGFRGGYGGRGMWGGVRRRLEGLSEAERVWVVLWVWSRWCSGCGVAEWVWGVWRKCGRGWRMVGMSFALRGGERRACVKWRVKWWLERAREVEAWRIRGKALSGQTHKVRLAAGWSGDAGLRERGRAFYFAADMREKPCRGKRTRCVWRPVG